MLRFLLSARTAHGKAGVLAYDASVTSLPPMPVAHRLAVAALLAALSSAHAVQAADRPPTNAQARTWATVPGALLSVGDLHAVLPAVTDEVNKRKG